MLPEPAKVAGKTAVAKDMFPDDAESIEAAAKDEFSDVKAAEVARTVWGNQRYGLACSRVCRCDRKASGER